jgi:hypothetical protein
VSQKGVYTFNPKPGWSFPARRVSPAIARELATNQSRVAYSYRSARGDGLALRRVTGRGDALTLAARAGQPLRSPVMSRYSVSWLAFEEGGEGPRVFRRRFGGHAPTGPRTEADRRLPADTDSIAMTGSVVACYLAADGVWTVSPPLRFGSSSRAQ